MTGRPLSFETSDEKIVIIKKVNFIETTTKPIIVEKITFGL